MTFLPYSFYPSLSLSSPFTGPRTRKPKKPATSSATAGSGGSDKSDVDGAAGCGAAGVAEDKRPRTAFSGTQLARLKVS